MLQNPLTLEENLVDNVKSDLSSYVYVEKEEKAKQKHAQTVLNYVHSHSSEPYRGLL